MKITKRQLRKIIKEEKSRLVREMNPDILPPSDVARRVAVGVSVSNSVVDNIAGAVANQEF